MLDFVTDVDIAAERRIADVFAKQLPQHAVFGEEGGWLQGSASGEFVWLIDPLCGTVNFSAGIPFFNVNLALMKEGEPMLGIMAEPMTREILWAERGLGAFVVTKDGVTTPIRPSVDAKIVDLGTDLKSGVLTKALRVLRRINDEKRFLSRVFNTSLGLGYAARGSFAACVHEYIEPLHAAAGAFICQEAGCIVSDLDGRPWTTDATSLIVAANQDAHNYILTCFATNPDQQDA